MYFIYPVNHSLPRPVTESGLERVMGSCGGMSKRMEGQPVLAVPAPTAVIFDPISPAFCLSERRSGDRRVSWEHFVSALVWDTILRPGRQMAPSFNVAPFQAQCPCKTSSQ